MGEESAHYSEAGSEAGARGVNGIVFDAGGLIAVERAERRVYAILAMALEEGARLIVPATALAQVIRNPARQMRLWRMVQHERTEIVPLDGAHALSVGAILARTKTADIADAHVVACAQRYGLAVITSDGDDLRRLDPAVELIEV